MNLTVEINVFNTNMDKLQSVADRLNEEQIELQISKAIAEAKRIGRMMRDESTTIRTGL